MLLTVIVASLVVFTIAAIAWLSRKDTTVARELLQATLPVLLAMLAALVATLTMRP